MSKTAFPTGIIVVLCITAGFNPVANAETAAPIFGDVTIQHPFSPDPLTVRGMSGGSVPGSKIAGKVETKPTGPCQGFMDQTPDHILKLTSKFEYLKLVIDSPSPNDTTMIIKGPGGTWCNDDFDGKNPGIVGEWLPGTYQIWIGSYKDNESLPYTLKITEGK
ncbi:hypothetical protein IQ226_17200 [Dolichospermum sp. LEGE 00240]|jgi:hypothetical protein|uniref:hypothetical protein n=1 Tax=Aphanizomenonaceae TaxID=1892259 RepID=UPI0018830463|nr:MULTISPECIES: hypothetical protein [Aphanizomenonaceae]MDM3845898.1 hypothetical protein [Aphanizomenon gracile PMC638.10]MDM3848625.1 hypothetical protein [Aphanizomenon gracile PMC627.10]MDM3856821.1 hypothetical protein [Aphanizomenon gracile PMC649.10]MDM3860123.1 hypothetical protein [Aphanizomenon gracile PMC644.10]MBE9250835.1 hypothetical protein [Dolichospermum sp. LEGE 00240]